MADSPERCQYRKGNETMGAYWCHDITEIYPGLYVSGMADAARMANLGLDVLIPLAGCPKAIEQTFPGEIRPYAIRNEGVLPQEQLKECVEGIIADLHQGKRVGLFCAGGHGRTGYLAACVLGQLGITDPIAWLRQNYCEQAVESYAQLTEIARWLHQPDWMETYKYTVDPYKLPVSEK